MRLIKQGGSPQTLHTRTCFGADRTGGTGVTRFAPPQPCYRSHMHSKRGLVLAPCHACRSTGAILLQAPGRTVTASIATAPVTRCRRTEMAQAARPIPSCFQAFAPPPKPGRPGCPCGGRCLHYPARSGGGDRFFEKSFCTLQPPHTLSFRDLIAEARTADVWDCGCGSPGQAVGWRV
jgi:hypothetical protein